MRGNFQEKLQQISQLTAKCFNSDKQFLRDRAIAILSKVRQIEGYGPRCVFCNEPLTLSVFLGLEETLVVWSQCPSCEMNWYVEPKVAEAFIQSLGGEEKIMVNLLALGQSDHPPQKEKIETVNINPHFQESIKEFFEALLQESKEKKGIEESCLPCNGHNYCESRKESVQSAPPPCFGDPKQHENNPNCFECIYESECYDKRNGFKGDDY